jgi:hypothetical protein
MTAAQWHLIILSSTLSGLLGAILQFRAQAVRAAATTLES